MSYCHDAVFAAFDNVRLPLWVQKWVAKSLPLWKIFLMPTTNKEPPCKLRFSVYPHTQNYLPLTAFLFKIIREYAEVRTYWYGWRCPTPNYVNFTFLVMKHIITCTTNGRMCNFHRHNTNVSCYNHEYVMNTLSVSSCRGAYCHRMYVYQNHRNTHMQDAFVTH